MQRWSICSIYITWKDNKDINSACAKIWSLRSPSHQLFSIWCLKKTPPVFSALWNNAGCSQRSRERSSGSSTNVLRDCSLHSCHFLPLRSIFSEFTIRPAGTRGCSPWSSVWAAIGAASLTAPASFVLAVALRADGAAPILQTGKLKCSHICLAAVSA